MAKQVSVTVLKPLDFKGHAYVPGDRIDVTAIDAVYLSQKNRVKLTRRKDLVTPPPADPMPAVDDPPKKVTRRKYHRKDLEVDETPANVPEPEPVSEPAESVE